MAITFVASAQAETGVSTSITVSKPTGTVENDLMLAFYGNGQDDGGIPSCTGSFTQIDYHLHSETANSSNALFYRVAGSSEGSNYTMDSSGSTSNLTSGVILTFRGIDTAQPFSVTYVEGSHYLRTANSTSPQPQPITTIEDNCFVVTFAHVKTGNTLTDITISSGFTEAEEILAVNRYMQAQYIDAGSATFPGDYTPGALALVGGDASEDTAMFTVALKPASSDIEASPILKRIRGY